MIKEASSYRDPSGFIFMEDGKIYRQVNQRTKACFDHFMGSGCYAELVKNKMLVSHSIIDQNFTGEDQWYTTLQPRFIPFISYAWEWSFHMLKDAALLTLEIHQTALKYGLSLKDATTYNVQFLEGKPLFIDSLSFEFYDEKKPWVAYRQFCEQFLAPLLLMHYSGLPLQSLQLAYPEGIPLKLASSLLPFRSRFSLHCYLHIHLNARVRSRAAAEKDRSVNFSRKKMEDMIRSLQLLLRSLQFKPKQSDWSDYYEEASLRNNYLADKKQIIAEWIGRIAPEIRNASDLGANDGEFSRFFTEKKIDCLAADLDPNCIDRLYLNIKKENNPFLQPLIQDLSLPSPGMGLNNEERTPFLNRAKRDAVLALALIHHLAIGKNIPLDKIASLFARLCEKWLIIEFVPGEDEKAHFMLRNKKDLFPDYNQQHFERAFAPHFNLAEIRPVQDSPRTLYLFKKKP